MLRSSQNSQSSHRVVESTDINGINMVRNLEYHVCAGHPNSRRTPLTEMLKSSNQSVNVGLHLCPLKGESFVPRLVRGMVRHESMATWAEWKGGALDVELKLCEHMCRTP